MSTIKAIYNRAKMARYLLRLMVGLAMLSLGAVLNENAPIALYVTNRTFVTIEAFRGMLLFGGGGLLIAPTRDPVLLFYLTLPLFIYAIGGVGGALSDQFQDWTGIVYLLLVGMFVVLYWRDA